MKKKNQINRYMLSSGSENPQAANCCENIVGK